MGQSASQNALSSHTTANKPDCFSDEELNNLKRLFDQLARRSPNATVDLEHFLEFFATLPGLHGDQLFIAFDRKKAGALDFDDFVEGMARACRGTRHSKIRLLFDMYDLKRDGEVSQAELRALVNHLPREELDEACGDSRRGAAKTSPGAPATRKKRRSFLDFTNDDVADKAFDECDANHDGKLDLAQFERWVGKTPGVLEFFDASMAQAVSFGAALNHRSKSDENLAGARKRPSFQKSTSFGALAPLGEGEVLEGPLWKVGATLGARHRRHFKLVSNILYYFKEASDPAPRGLVFLGGCQCEPVDEGDLRGFRVVHWDAEKLGERPQQLYAADEEERDKWVAAIRAAIGGKAHALDDFYDVGAELGSGAFASVHEATHRASRDRVAVKHIEKGDKDDDEAKDHREMCRREIAVMRLASHKHVLPLIEVFEDRDRIHIVLPYRLGNLRQRLERTRAYGELSALRVCQRVFDAVAYLHQLGIAHRDLKAENILCDDDESYNSIQVADFGIAQVLRPEEDLEDCRGTIEYCAPEVFLRQGCGFPADVWSVGCIGFYVLFGSLPFQGDRKAETIGYILEGEIQNSDWDAVDDVVQDLFTDRVLVVDVEKRITAQDALAHAWISPLMERSSTVTSRDHPAVTGSWFPSDLILPKNDLM